MFKYLIEFTRFGASMIVEYNEHENIVSLTVNYGDMEPTAIAHLVAHIPAKCDQIDHYRSKKNVKVTDIHFDTSFNTFWNSYANKFGNKTRSQRLWDALNQEERIKAIRYIQVYNQWLLKSPGINKKLPETYLNQAPWNN